MVVIEGSFKMMGKLITFIKEIWLKFMLFEEECLVLGYRVGEVKVLFVFKEFRVY